MYGTTTSTMAGSIDTLFFVLVGVSAFFLLLITGLLIYFAIRYRSSRHPEASPIEGSTALEITWTVIPLIIFLAIFYYGFEGFRRMRDVPEDALVVQVTGRMWDWVFTYENGKQSEKLYVPIYRPVKLVLTSVDVNHSFFIPAFRIKEDVVPGKETFLWFKPQTTGAATVFCAEFCGTRHAYMMTEVVVLEEQEFQLWYASPEADQAGPGAVTVMYRNGCLTCHSIDGGRNTGPTFLGLFGSTRTVQRAGRQYDVIADEAYLRRAIMEPAAEHVVGFPPNMPVPIGLSGEELDEIIEYLKALGGEAGGGVRDAPGGGTGNVAGGEAGGGLLDEAGDEAGDKASHGAGSEAAGGARDETAGGSVRSP